MSPSTQTFPTHTLHIGHTPLVISVPHAGTALPPELEARFTPLALRFPDTDWHVDKLYDFAPGLGATMLVARYSRYLIDLNRPPDDAALYGSAAGTGLCPTHTFAGECLYRDGSTKLAMAEVEKRRAQYWQPYHDALSAQLAEARRQHGFALLLDAHSIRSVVPRLFDGTLPDFNLGTYDGRSCGGPITEAVRACLAAAPRWSQVVDGRFKGGHITRHFGRPREHVHALQIELAQSGYMDENAAGYDAGRAAPLRSLLSAIVEALLRLQLDSV
jgi:N-formylglutamate deformylase